MNGTANISLSLSGTLDPDQLLFAICLGTAAKFAKTFDELTSVTEALIEGCENSWRIERESTH